MATIPVKWFSSTMTGIPVINVTYGDTVTLLDAVLVNGFNPQTITSLTRVDTTATATANGHGYLVDQVISISGSDQPVYNGEFRVTSITANTFTFEVTGSPITPATGSMTAKAAPLGFEIAFTGTNKRVYRSKNPLSNRPYLRVDNSLDPAWTSTYALLSKVTVAENMTDIDTFQGVRAPYDPSFPTKNETVRGTEDAAINGWYKWYQAISGVGSTLVTNPSSGSWPTEWMIFGDDRGFLFFNHYFKNNQYSFGRSVYGFGDFESFKQGDGYNYFLLASESYQAANNSVHPAQGNEFGISHNYTGKVLPRDYTGVGNNCRFALFSLNFSSTGSIVVSGLTSSMPFPNGPDFGFWLTPMYMKEETRGDIRGIMPGVYFLPQNQPYSDKAVVENVPQYPGRKFMLLDVAYATVSTPVSRVAVDMIGPWR